MKILVLGGTRFLGRHFVEAALGRGYEVTLFTRGQTNPELFPEAEHLVGDRDGNLSALEGREWDAVLDTSAYWPWRVAAGGEMAAPAPPERPMQFIDVRDLAGWILGLVEGRAGGVYNATNDGVPWADVLAASPGDARAIWVDEGFLLEQGVEENELPLWTADSQFAAIHEADVSQALAEGLTFRPVEETTSDTLEWARNRG